MGLKDQIINDILPCVTNPAQYIGIERNARHKEAADVDLSVALAFPDVYEIGMSHLGLQILYDIVNAEPRFCAERVFAPLPDCADELARAGLPLASLESGRPLREFDVLGFSCQHELSYTTVLWMLELAGVPLLAKDRTDADPLVVAGGPCAFSPEPLAPFIDAWFVGDAEESFPEFLHLVRAGKRDGASRGAILAQCARRIGGVYVPSLYTPQYDSNGRLCEVTPAPGAPFPVTARVVRDLDSAPYPVRPVVPLARTVHDRIMVEIMRGCPNACRFCQAGATKRPVRVRSQDRIIELAESTYEHTGHNEIALVSLSSSDYPDILGLAQRLAERFRDRHVNLSLPSLRVGKALQDLPKVLADVRRAGFTLAPEAASDRLRTIINKPVSEADLENGLRDAYRAGWKVVKLYFMVGLPGERDDDVTQIPVLCQRLSRLRRDVASGAAQINATVSTFVPKAMTPFQWARMIPLEETLRLQGLILTGRRGPIRYKFHDARQTFIEAVFARGDRRLAQALLAARSLGAKLDEWREYFDFDLWMSAFAQAGVDPAAYACRERASDEVLPWDHLSAGVPKERLRAQYEQAMNDAQDGI